MLHRFEITHISRHPQESLDWPAHESAFDAAFALGVAVYKSHDFGGDHERIQRVYEHFKRMQTMHPTHEQLSAATSKLHGFCYNDLYEAFCISSPEFEPVLEASCTYASSGIALSQPAAMALTTESSRSHAPLSQSDQAQVSPEKLEKRYKSSILPDVALQTDHTRIEASLDAANNLFVPNGFTSQTFSTPARGPRASHDQRLIRPPLKLGHVSTPTHVVGDVPQVQSQLGNQYDFSEPSPCGLDILIEPFAIATSQTLPGPSLMAHPPFYPVADQRVANTNDTTASFSSFASVPSPATAMLCGYGVIGAQTGYGRKPDGSVGY